MAAKIQALDTEARKFVTASSRYIGSTVLAYGDDNLLTFETYKRPEYIPSSTDRFAVVPAGEEYRPDLTSFRAYGTVDFWWQILEVNGIFDVFDYKAGLNVRIPQPYNKL